MKIISKTWRDEMPFETIKDAVQDALTPAAYSYDGQIEGLNAKIEKLQEMVATLIDCLYGEAQYRSPKADQLRDILGYGYEVEE